MKTKLRKSKKISVRKLKDRVWELCSQYIRMRDCLKTTGDIDYGHCITCGRFIRRTEAHAGHFISRSHSATLFDETNVHLQCPRCNLFCGGEPLKYRREIVRLYGEGYDLELEEKAMQEKHWTIVELEKLKEDFKKKIKKLSTSSK